MQLELLLSATLTFKQHIICIIPCHTPTFPAYAMTVVFRMCQRISISTCILVPSVLLCQINCTLQFGTKYCSSTEPSCQISYPNYYYYTGVQITFQYQEEGQLQNVLTSCLETHF